SELDVRLARVSFDEARLLVAEADKDWQAALTVLTNLVGPRPALVSVQLVSPAPPVEPTPGVDALIDLALRDRPELLRQRAEVNAARATARAARDARLPSVSLAAAAGVMPT